MDKKPSSRAITAFLLGSAALFLGIYDVVVAYNDVEGDTISELVRDLGHSWYVLPYAFGTITGHFFWNKAVDEMLPRAAHLTVFFTVVLGSCALVLIRDLVNVFWALPHYDYANLTLVVVGFFVGAKFWPQHLPTKEETPNG